MRGGQRPEEKSDILGPIASSDLCVKGTFSLPGNTLDALEKGDENNRVRSLCINTRKSPIPNTAESTLSHAVS